MAKRNNGFLYLIAVVLAMSAVQCKVPLDSGASSPNYIRLLGVDPPQAVNAMRKTKDGNILFLTTVSVPRGDTGTISNFEITTCDLSGNLISSKRYGDSLDFVAADCVVLSDGSIIVVGTLNTGPNRSSIEVFHIDALGKVLSAKPFAVSQDVSHASAVCQLGNGSFVVEGWRHNGLYSCYDGIFLYLSATADSTGLDIVSDKQKGDDYKALILSPGQSNDWVGLGTFVKNSSNAEPWVFSSINGQLGSSAMFSNHGGTLRSVLRTNGQNYVVVGDSSIFSTSSVPTAASIALLSFASLDGTSQPIWYKNFSLDIHNSFTNVISASSGGLAVTGFTANAAGDTSIVMFRFDDSGKEVWPHQTYPFEGGDIPAGILETPDHGFAIGGVTTSFGGRPSRRQLFLLRVNADGTTIK